MNEDAAELEWLRWFYRNVDLGYFDAWVLAQLEEMYVEQTGKKLPEGYDSSAHGYKRVSDI